MPRDMADPLSDEALLALYARGDPGAARLLTERHLGRVLGYATRLLGDRAEAEDVAQETMLRLWRMAPDWQADRAQLSSWLYRVVTNLCTDRRRKARRNRTEALDPDNEPADPTPGTEARLMVRARMDALQAALDDLPERQREAVVLRHIEGLSNPEIAGILGLGVEAVESLTARGKRALALALQGRKAALGFEERG